MYTLVSIFQRQTSVSMTHKILRIACSSVQGRPNPETQRALSALSLLYSALLSSIPSASP